MAAYARPAGYKYDSLIAGAIRYKPNNGFVNSNGMSGYTPGGFTPQRVNGAVSAAPADGSQIQVQDAVGVKTFTYVWNGAPGAGIIPLVAGGGTAAQAATAASVALAAQLVGWTVTNPSAGNFLLTSKTPGTKYTTFGNVSGVTNTVFTRTDSVQRAVLPGGNGKVRAFLSGI